MSIEQAASFFLTQGFGKKGFGAKKKGGRDASREVSALGRAKRAPEKGLSEKVQDEMRRRNWRMLEMNPLTQEQIKEVVKTYCDLSPELVLFPDQVRISRCLTQFRG